MKSKFQKKYDFINAKLNNKQTKHKLLRTESHYTISQECVG